MPRWEYLEAYVQADVWHDSRGQIIKLEPRRVPVRGITAQYAALTEILNQLGAEGWELVAVVSVEAPYAALRLFLRRAIGMATDGEAKNS